LYKKEKYLKPCLFKIIAEVLGCDPTDLSMEDSPESVDQWDSLAMLNLIMNIENSFNIELSQNELIMFDSIGNIAEMLNKRNLSFV
jgi:acyl carrier protein